MSNKKEMALTTIHSDYLPVIPDVQRVAEFVEFARWCATASWLRDPKTQKDFAERFGVSQDSLTDWKRHPAFTAFVWQFLRERMEEQIPDAVQGLFDKLAIGKGTASDLQLLIRITTGESKKPDKK